MSAGTVRMVQNANKLRERMMQKSILSLTDAAANRLRQLKQESGKPNFRLGVKSRGCNGMSYTLDFADKPEKFEDVVSEKDITIFITPQASMSVVGTLMDYQDDKLKSEFIFENPNATSTCGCGESFTTTANMTTKLPGQS